MKAAEVLPVLTPGGMLTVAQIGRDAALIGGSARNALAGLDARGSVVRSRTRIGWQIGAHGRAVSAVGRARSSR